MTDPYGLVCISWIKCTNTSHCQYKNKHTSTPSPPTSHPPKQTNKKRNYTSTVLSFKDMYDRPTSLNSIPTFIHISQEFCEMTGADYFAFLYPLDLEWRSKSLKQALKYRVQYHLSSYHAETNRFIKIHIHTYLFLDPTSKTYLSII